MYVLYCIFQTFALAGLAAGVTEAVVVNPFEVVKVRLQSDRNPHAQRTSAWVVTRQIVSESGFGFRGLNLGLTATCLRNGSFNMIYFGFFYSVKPLLPPSDDERIEVCKKLALGFAGGIFGSMFNLPFDVAKSRIQRGLAPDKYKTTFGTMAVVLREEGFRALYNGLLPKCLRFGPGGAIMLTVYEYVYDFLKLKFPD
ncbi:unnamed protein product [Notodromas monacha]|uniref:Mitochondrial 2-oxodicarboxylate carrier n=1 Tax=Notodromas monacha TaxID=399045 RepID=A0A7R9BUS6_9CRUS|nr:unnamed protein product [Notodromas monacha]CAG0921100.1 unnamed protein product [Notodromas monacha]